LIIFCDEKTFDTEESENGPDKGGYCEGLIILNAAVGHIMHGNHRKQTRT